jgi:hypothetical protein
MISFYNELFSANALAQFALDFETAGGLDCDRCWPIKYLKCRPREYEVNELGAAAVC